MNKYLLSALSLIALTQAASAAKVGYHVTLEGGRKGESPPALALEFGGEDVPNQRKSLETSKGQHTVEVLNGTYTSIMLWGDDGATGWMECTAQHGKPLGKVHLPQDHFSLSIVVKADNHYTWIVSTCEVSGG